MLSGMSLSVAALVGLLVAVAGGLFWGLRFRLSARSGGVEPAGQSREPTRFETTMGELRDLREALRDVQHQTPSKGQARVEVNRAS
jgi:hypothetical protein